MADITISLDNGGATWYNIYLTFIGYRTQWCKPSLAGETGVGGWKPENAANGTRETGNLYHWLFTIYYWLLIRVIRVHQRLMKKQSQFWPPGYWRTLRCLILRLLIILLARWILFISACPAYSAVNPKQSQSSRLLHEVDSVCISSIRAVQKITKVHIILHKNTNSRQTCRKIRTKKPVFSHSPGKLVGQAATLRI